MELLYEIWLHTICDFDPGLVAKIVPRFERRRLGFSSPELDMLELREIGVPEKLANRIGEPEYFKKATDIIEYCRDNGIRIVTQRSEEYPNLLLNTGIAPRLFFAKGRKLELNDAVSVSVSGSRKPSDQGKVIARGIGRSLAENGIVTVSGMAEGIDAEAHWGAIEGGGITIAVLAGGVDVIYPLCNRKLYYEIIKHGTVISERPPGTVGKGYFYQQRNRLVVGLGLGTVFVEGEIKSGTSMTARLALDNNRDIFAVPGNPMNPHAGLPNQLIAEGAIVVNDTNVPAEYYRAQNPELFKAVPRIPEPEEPQKAVLTEEDKIIKYLKEKGDAIALDEISEALGIAVSALSGKLTVLAIKGSIRQESGNRYIIAKK
ncbi:MAG: DNA-processing protein DprA [Ruminococcaceae bacterium]|nr:DNA-processing protein DprA [Oscillospiraceae bacterium]